MLQDLFAMEINGKMSGGLNTFASNCIYHQRIQVQKGAEADDNLSIPERRKSAVVSQDSGKR